MSVLDPEKQRFEDYHAPASFWESTINGDSSSAVDDHYISFMIWCTDNFEAIPDEFNRGWSWGLLPTQVGDCYTETLVSWAQHGLRSSRTRPVFGKLMVSVLVYPTKMTVGAKYVTAYVTMLHRTYVRIGSTMMHDDASIQFCEFGPRQPYTIEIQWLTVDKAHGSWQMRCVHVKKDSKS